MTTGTAAVETVVIVAAVKTTGTAVVQNVVVAATYTAAVLIA